MNHAFQLAMSLGQFRDEAAFVSLCAHNAIVETTVDRSRSILMRGPAVGA